MSGILPEHDDPLLERALLAARDTKFLVLGGGVRHDSARVFGSVFGPVPAVVVADEWTFQAAGRDVHESFERANHPLAAPILLPSNVYADESAVNTIQRRLEAIPGIPVAVGSGTINDLTKLASHRAGRPYMAVATAASMDGYTAYGASITARGSKQTFDCPAPKAVLADLDVIALAPSYMNASGYADLLAKNVAGADWILADAVGVEPIDPAIWDTVQSHLRDWVGSPKGVARGEPDALRNLVQGLMMGGFAMQAAQTSRPASGAEHQFSHLWDMQHHTYQGAAPSHGFKVGVGTLASLALYEDLLHQDVGRLDVDALVAGWPTLETVENRIVEHFGAGALAAKAIEETRAKEPSPEALRDQLTRLCQNWPGIQERLHRHLIPFVEAKGMLRDAGCPFEPEQIGISRLRLRGSYESAGYIRRRFTVLDVVKRLGVFESAMEQLFGPDGRWSSQRGRS
ncbi:MAG: sn-glycerol-1-phosphate dehydrogenase [Isosphaeraceae bacterium]